MTQMPARQVSSSASSSASRGAGTGTRTGTKRSRPAGPVVSFASRRSAGEQERDRHRRSIVEVDYTYASFHQDLLANPQKVQKLRHAVNAQDRQGLRGESRGVWPMPKPSSYSTKGVRSRAETLSVEAAKARDAGPGPSLSSADWPSLAEERNRTVCIWDFDETMRLLQSLLSGSQNGRSNGNQPREASAAVATGAGGLTGRELSQGKRNSVNGTNRESRASSKVGSHDSRSKSRNRS